MCAPDTSGVLFAVHSLSRPPGVILAQGGRPWSAPRQWMARAMQLGRPSVANILCIDREPGVGQTLERVLAGMGHPPFVVGRLDTGLSIAAREPFDLIISDEELPDGSVSDLLRALREQGQDVQIG